MRIVGNQVLSFQKGRPLANDGGKKVGKSTHMTGSPSIPPKWLKLMVHRARDWVIGISYARTLRRPAVVMTLAFYQWPIAAWIVWYPNPLNQKKTYVRRQITKALCHCWQSRAVLPPHLQSPSAPTCPEAESEVYIVSQKSCEEWWSIEIRADLP